MPVLFLLKVAEPLRGRPRLRSRGRGPHSPYWRQKPQGHRQLPNGTWTRETKFVYDALRRKVGHTLPLGQTQSWSYNALGQLTTNTDFLGQTIQYQYDTLGRVHEKDLYAVGATTPSKVVTYTYASYDAAGNRHDTVTTPDGTTETVSDLNGRLIQVNSPEGTINYGYDSATGLKTSVSTANTDIQYAYDEVGRLHTVTVDKLNGSTVSPALVTTYAYNLADNLLTTNLPNGTTETRTYDTLNRLKSLTNTGPSGVISSYTYTLDAAGHRTSVLENTGRRVDYTYDNLYRLTREAITDASAGNRTIDYVYDLAGNRVNRSDSGAPGGQVTLHYEYDDNDRLTSVSGFSSPYYNANYTYDANGNTLTVSGTNVDPGTYTWDIENRLIHADVTDHTTGTTRHVDYQYNDSGNRLSQTVDGQKTTYLNDANQALDQVLEEYAPGGALAATYVRGMDLLFQDRGGTRSYYAKDGLGSTRVLTNGSGAVTDTYVYDAFGNILGWTDSTPNVYLFAGQQLDTETQRYYLRARYYDPTTQDFMSRDTQEGDLNLPLTLHKYSYVQADPVNLVDASGHDGESLTSQIVVTGIQSGLAGIVIGAPFRAYRAALQLRDGVAVREVLRQAALGALTDFGVGFSFGALFRALKLLQVAEKLIQQGIGPIFSKIRFASPALRPGTQIPTYFELATDAGPVFVKEAATKHIPELVQGFVSRAVANGAVNPAGLTRFASGVDPGELGISYRQGSPEPVSHSAGRAYNG